MNRRNHKPESEEADLLRERVAAWAKKMGVFVRQIHVRAMRTKWASCSTAGRVTLDSKVADLPPELADYVTVHELLHLRVPNHGKLWKSLMTAYLGDWEGLEQRLNLHVKRGNGNERK